MRDFERLERATTNVERTLERMEGKLDAILAVTEKQGHRIRRLEVVVACKQVEPF